MLLFLQKKKILPLLALLALAPAARAAGTLREAVEASPDTLDPAVSGSYVERVVNGAACDALLDLDGQGRLVPELATGWEWSADRLALVLHLRDGVRFQDGAPFDAEAARANLERYRTAPYSARRGELSPVLGEDVLDARTLRIRLSAPYAPLPALLANRSGTMLSPRTLGEGTAAIGRHPVCAGPFSVVQWVEGDHITLERFGGYWNAGAVSLDRVEFRIMPDPGVRLVNLRAGAIDVAARLAATDVGATGRTPGLRVERSPSLGFELLSFNLANGARARTPFGQDVRVRRAFALSLDLAAINAAVFDGRMIPGDQFEPEGSAFHDPDLPPPHRDLPAARALLAQAGVAHPALVLSVSNTPVDMQVGEVIQAMAGEAGFAVTLNAGEPVAQTQAETRGDYQAALAIWSGRPDPQGNTDIWLRCGAPLNWTGWCSAAEDAALARGAAATDEAGRVAAYREAAAIVARDLPYLAIYHLVWFWGVREAVRGFVPRPDGVVRMMGVSAG